MNKTIYHGSSHIIRKPLLGSGKAFNDFGIGFYCTENLTKASEWAVKRNRNGFVSSYSMDCNGLRIIDLCNPQYTVLHWINMLFNYREFDAGSKLLHDAKEYINREFQVDYQGSDCIAGYSADSSSFAVTSAFLNGIISFQKLKASLIDESAGRQFVLKSNRAFDRILYTGYTAVSSAAFYPGMNSSELKRLNKAYSGIGDEGLFITQMIEEEIKAYDPRLR